MSGQPIKVLYVDDDPALARLVQKTLGRRGFEVDIAAGSEQALERIAGGDIDVIALDHYLANSTGLDFLATLARTRQTHVPVVYVTGSTEMKVAVAALKAGAIDFVPKTIGEEFVELLSSSLSQAVEKDRLRAEKEAAEQQVREQRDRAELLLSEVNHRVANSLALVSSLVSLQSKSVSDKIAKDALAETQARIFAIAQVHKRLYSSGDVRFVELDEYLTGLLDHLQAVMQSEGHGASLSYELAPLKLGTDASVNLGVVVTEWVTNAFKYAYPDQPGSIRVRLGHDDGKVELTVEDDGVGLNIHRTVQGTGLGSRIVSAMAKSMRAEAIYADRNPGTRARLLFSPKPI